MTLCTMPDLSGQDRVRMWSLIIFFSRKGAFLVANAARCRLDSSGLITAALGRSEIGRSEVREDQNAAEVALPMRIEAIQCTTADQVQVADKWQVCHPSPCSPHDRFFTWREFWCGHMRHRLLFICLGPRVGTSGWRVETLEHACIHSKLWDHLRYPSLKTLSLAKNTS